MANFKKVTVELTLRECEILSLAVDTLYNLINDNEIEIDVETIGLLSNDLEKLQQDGFTNCLDEEEK